MNNDLKQKLEVIIIPILLLEKLPTTDYGVAFVAWGVYNKIGPIYLENDIRITAEEFVRDHRFCIKIVDQLIYAVQYGDLPLFSVLSKELMEHPDCFEIVEKMFPRRDL